MPITGLTCHTCLIKEKKMTNISLRSLDVPNLSRYGVGFERMFNHIDEILRINAQHNTNYPPFNMIKTDDDRYTIEIAVAGFKPGEVSITVKNHELIVEGKRFPADEDQREFVHRGISGRDFIRVFWLNEHVIVKNAKQENGILAIDLEREVPEEKKPRAIPISYLG